MRVLNNKKNLYRMAGTIAGVSCLIMVIFPEIALTSAQKGVSLWASSVLPALLPFFICVNFMTKLGLPQIIGMAFEKPFRAIFGAPGVSAFIFTVSITSGYPMGAKIMGDMGREGQISKDEAKQMMTFCTTSGPLFMLGAVGAGMLGSPVAGLIITLSHYIGAIINGIFYRIMSVFKGSAKDAYGINKFNNFTSPREIARKNHGILEMFTDSILSSLKSLGIICGYIVLFTMMTDFMVYSGVLDGFHKPSVALIKGIFEMTVGCNSMASINNLSLLTICAACAFIISFGGVSIMAQSMSMMSGLGISTFYYIKVKLTHGIFALATALIIGPAFLNGNLLETGLLMGPISGEGSIIAENFGFLGGLDGIYCLFFSTKMVIMLIIIMLALVAVENQLRGKKDESSRNNSGI